MRRLARSAILLAPLLGGCNAALEFSGLVRPVGETVPEGQSFIDQPRAVPAAAPGPGRQVALLGVEVDDMEGLVAAPLFVNYMNGLMDRLLAEYPKAVPPHSIRIDASSTPRAFTSPNRDIYVSLGLLDALETESQLAAVLAHEAGHIQLGHFARGEYFDAQRKAVRVGAEMGVLAVTAAALRMQGSGASAQVVLADPKAAEEKAAKLAVVSRVVTQLSDDGLSTLLGRTQEEEADLVAADLLDRAGFDPDGTPDMLRVLGEVTAQRRSLADTLEDKRQQTEAELAALSNPVLVFQQLPAKFIEFGVAASQETYDRIKATHPSAADRQVWVADYVDLRYEDDYFDPEGRAQDLVKLRDAMTRYFPERVRRGHAAASAAKLSIAQDRMQDAEREIAVALNSPARDSAHVRVSAYFLEDAEGRSDQALHHLEAIDADEVRPNAVYTLLAAAYIQKHQFGRAEGILDEGADRFGSPDPFYPARIILAVAQDDEAQAREALNSCRGAASDDIKLACDQAIAPMALADLEPAAEGTLIDQVGRGWQKFQKGLKDATKPPVGS